MAGGMGLIQRFYQEVLTGGNFDLVSMRPNAVTIVK